MKQLKKFFLLLFLLCKICFAEESPKVKFEGDWSYQILKSNSSVSLNGDGIINTSNAQSAKMKVCFMLTDSTYKGGIIQGWVLTEKELDMLESGQHYEDLRWKLPYKNQPDDGEYYIVLLLCEMKYGLYGIADWLTFSEKLSFRNTIKPEIENLLKEYNIAKEKAEQWYQAMLVADNTMQMLEYMEYWNQWSAKRDELASQLLKKGYSVYSPNANYIPQPQRIARYEDIKEPVQSNVATPLPVMTPLGVPDYSTPSQTTQPQKIREICPSCKGKRRTLYCSYPPSYGLKYSELTKEWCDICESLKPVHTHPYMCTRCKGTGYIERYEY